MLTGGCRCGETRYTIALDAVPPAYACHCHQCQRWSGSAFAIQLLIPEAIFAVTGPVIVYERATEDRTSYQRICSTCHTRIYNTNTRRPGVAVVRAGTLDRSEELECVAHIFTATHQRWFAIPDGVANWPDMPDLGALGALMMPQP